MNLELLKKCDGKHKNLKDLFACESCDQMFLDDDNNYQSTYKARLNADREVMEAKRESSFGYMLLMGFVLLGGLYVLDLLLNILFNTN